MQGDGIPACGVHQGDVHVHGDVHGDVWLDVWLAG